MLFPGRGGTPLQPVLSDGHCRSSAPAHFYVNIALPGNATGDVDRLPRRKGADVPRNGAGVGVWRNERHLLHCKKPNDFQSAIASREHCRD